MLQNAITVLNLSIESINRFNLRKNYIVHSSEFHNVFDLQANILYSPEDRRHRETQSCELCRISFPLT